MARPGLEPGTPRFSVVPRRSGLRAQTPGGYVVSADARDRKIFAVSGYLSPLVGMAGASDPVSGPAPCGLHLDLTGSRPGRASRGPRPGPPRLRTSAVPES